MSLTITKLFSNPVTVGDRWLNVVKCDLDNSYPSGGYSLKPADMGFMAATDDEFHVKAISKAGYIMHYDHTTQKLQVYEPSKASSEFAYSPGGGDVKGATAITAAMGTADQASDAVNAGLWVNYQTVTTINGAAGSFGSISAQPAFGRNAVITLKNDSGGNFTLFTGTTAFTVTGKYRGQTQTETINLVLTGGQVTLAHGPNYRAVAGVKPFDSITSVTIDATSLAGLIANSAGGLKIGVGPGVLFGFPVAPQTGADADILDFSVNAVARTIAGNMDYTNQTFNVGTIADGDDVAIVYAVRGGEVANAADLSAVTAVRVEALGRFRG